jgi:hypothetical protein
MVGLQFSGGEGSEGVSFCAVGWVIRKQEVCCGKVVLYMVL